MTCPPFPLSQGLDPALLFTTQTLTVYVAYAVTLCSHGRAEAGEHKLEHILLSKYINSRDSFYWQMFFEPLTLDIFMHIKSTFLRLMPVQKNIL